MIKKAAKIYSTIDDKCICIWKNHNYSRERPDNYFDPRIKEIRLKTIHQYSDIQNSFEYGCGTHPLPYSLSKYDKYLPEYYPFKYDKFIKSEMLLLFDALQQMEYPIEFLQMLPQKYVYITVPTVQIKCFNSLKQIQNWKHYKPGEQKVYANEDGWKEIIYSSGWTIQYHGYDECPPRVDISTFILTRPIIEEPAINEPANISM